MDYYFDANLNLLKLCGMWRPHSKERLYKKILHYTVSFIALVETCTIFPIYEAMAMNIALLSLSNFIFYMKLFLSHLSGAVRFLLFHYYSKRFFNILDRLKQYNNPKMYEDDVYPVLYKRKARVNKYRSYILSALAASLSFPRNIEAMKRLFFDDNQFRNNGTPVELAFMTAIPWDHQASTFSFFWAIMFQWQATFHHGLLISCFLLFYLGVLENIAMHFDMIKRACGSFGRRVSKTGRNREEDIAREMRKITVHIQTIIKVCDDMNDICMDIMLFQIIFSLTTLCACIYMLSIVSFGSATFVGEITYWIALSIELFIYSYYGTIVTHAGLEIPTALFHMDWYSFDKSTQSNVMINIMRMQKPIYFTIGKFQPISLATFISISKGSYSLYAVLKTTN